MKARVLASLTLCGCGGVAIVSADASVDALNEATDAVTDSTDDASLPSCKTDVDCFGYETCQSGWCCTGTLADGQCRCDDAPGCDLSSDCCYFNYQEADALTCNHGGCGIYGHH